MDTQGTSRRWAERARRTLQSTKWRDEQRLALQHSSTSRPLELGWALVPGQERWGDVVELALAFPQAACLRAHGFQVLAPLVICERPSHHH